MGAKLSLINDYNRTLAKQPRKSIDIKKFQVSNNLQQHPLTGTLSIPDPVHISQLNNQIPDSSNKLSHSELDQTLIQPKNSSPIIDNQIQKKSIVRSSSYSLISNQTMNNDAIVISRSVMNLNNHRRLNNNHLSSFRPNRMIIERNGKQFLTELKERMERRYVQVFDENTGEIRLFEVIDYIPSRTVRSMRINQPQFQSQNGFSRNFLPSNFSFNQRSALPPTSNNRRELAPPSNLVDFKGLKNRETVAREFDLYHSGANLALNNNPPPAITSRPQLKNQDSVDSAYDQSEYAQPKAYNTSTPASQEVSNQHSSRSHHSQATSFRQHSPTDSGYSISASTASTITSNNDSDSEGIDRTLSKNQNNTTVSYGTAAGYNSSNQFDPFAKPIRTSDHHYAKRSGINNYSEPIINNRRFQTSTVSDYAPIPMAHNQPNQNQYSHRKDSNAYDG